MAGIAAFIVTVILLLSERRDVSSSSFASDTIALREKLAAVTDEAAGLRRSLTRQLDVALEARRNLRLSDAMCSTACSLTDRMAQNPRLRAKIETRVCGGVEHNLVCCQCLDQGYVISSAAVSAQALLETAREAMADSIAARLVDVVGEKAAAAKKELLSEPARPPEMEVDDLDPAAIPVTCAAKETKQVGCSMHTPAHTRTLPHLPGAC
jgi:hypothetical protein